MATPNDDRELMADGWNADDALTLLSHASANIPHIRDALCALRGDDDHEVDGYEEWVIASRIRDTMDALAQCPPDTLPVDMPEGYDPTGAECVRAATCGREPLPAARLRVAFGTDVDTEVLDGIPDDDNVTGEPDALDTALNAR